MQVKRDNHAFSSKNCMETTVHSAKTNKSGHLFIHLKDYVVQGRMNKQSGFNAEQIKRINSSSAESVLAGEKLVATYSISM
jgi:hypothetical protein